MEEVELASVKGDEGDHESLNLTTAITEVAQDDLDKKTEPTLPTEEELNPHLAKFMEACQQGDLSTVKQLTTDGDVGVADTFSAGITGLHWAAINNRLDIVKYLVENHADPNYLGGDLNASPLHWACRNGLVYIVDYLINNGADPSLKDSQSYNALHLSVHSSNIMLVIYILYKCPQLYIDEPDSFNRTSLHWACYQGDILTVQLLLKLGADVTKTDNSLFTPLHWSFMKVYKPILKLLLEYGSDIFAKNDLDKDSFAVAKDMNCYDVWTRVLAEDYRYSVNNWEKKPPFIDAKWGKIITFFTPFVVLPIIFKINDYNNGYIIPKLFVSVLLLYPVSYILRKYIIGSFVPDRVLLKSPLASGIFSGTFFWLVITYICTVLPKLMFEEFSYFCINLLLLGVMAVIGYSFYKAMTLNPGLVPVPTDKSKILAQIQELVNQKEFTPENFCVNSYIRKPLRSKYSHYNKRLIARFDHFCPWAYNEIGVRNHKIFVIFVYALNLGIILWVFVLTQYFEQLLDGYESDDVENQCYILDENLCTGFRSSNFSFNLLVWTCAQGCWLTFLTVTQTFQILKGVTTHEFHNLSTQKNSNACFKLLGLDQFMLTVRSSLATLLKRNVEGLELTQFDIPSDYGMRQNWLDFWFLGEIKFRNMLYIPLNGENNLNGKLVDYYTLYEWPPKDASIIA